MKAHLVTRDDGITVLERPKLRQYPWRGAVVNPDCPAPPSPGPWVDETRCAVCGALYQAHRGTYDGHEAARRLRAAAKAAGDDGGGFRSRRAVLWWLRVLKLEDWFTAHLLCGGGWDFTAGRPHPLEDRKMERARLPAVVELRWDNFPDVIYVRGHFDPDDDRAPEALEAAGLALDQEAEDRDLDAYERPRLGIGRQVWARWGLGRDEDGEITQRCFYVSAEKTRGAFAVTEVLDLDERDRARAELAAREAREAAGRALVARWFPEASAVEAYSGFKDALRVGFRLPELASRVDFDTRNPGSLYVENRDLEAFQRLYGERKRPSLSELPWLPQPAGPERHPELEAERITG